MRKRPEIVFITRNYPPQTGGLEVYSYHLIKCFDAHHTVRKIALGRSRYHLLWFLPLALAYALSVQVGRRRVPVHLCDGLLSPLGVVLKALTGTRVSATVHGLDVTYPNRFYQRVIPHCLARLDQLVCVSRATRTATCHRGVSEKICAVIPNGVDPNAIYNPVAAASGRESLSRQTGGSLQSRRILLSVGRLVRRKGVAWFIKNVMPTLDLSWVYIVAGDGPEAHRIRSAVQESGLTGRVFLLGRVSDEERDLLLNTADLFVMPNLQVEGDMEGFGIAAIEAGSCGLPVVASDLEGLKDAVMNGITGYLVEAENREAFRRAVEDVDLERARVRGAVIEHYGWEKIFRRYQEILLPQRSVSHDKEA